ncbi:hypothetical protein TNCV_4214791 [Trichonephila clavipes]|nr:hypothetical protein TNCV_4214791 [Trichonephila clavipes]
MFEKVSVLLGCPTISSKEFVPVDDDNVYFDDENEMNHAAPVPTSSEMRIIMKSTRSYLDAYSDGEMNNKMDDGIEQFDAKNDNARENI